MHYYHRSLSESVCVCVCCISLDVRKKKERIGNYFGKVCNTHPSHSIIIIIILCSHVSIRELFPSSSSFFFLSCVALRCICNKEHLEGEIKSIIDAVKDKLRSVYDRTRCHSHTYTIGHLVQDKRVSFALIMSQYETIKTTDTQDRIMKRMCR